MVEEMENRRPIKARNTDWASSIASFLVKLNVSPNSISVFSVVFALFSGICFAISANYQSWHKSLLLVLAALFIQLRLLCNLFDGMVAIEGGMKSKSGEVFNDFPDRLADPFILIGIGYAAKELSFAVELGWLAGLLAVMAAYVRYLGTAAGAGTFFVGPMAKQHRMAAATFAAILQAIILFWYKPLYVLYFALCGIVLGCIITIIRRVVKIVQELERA